MRGLSGNQDKAARPQRADYGRRWERAAKAHWNVERKGQERGRAERMVRQVRGGGARLRPRSRPPPPPLFQMAVAGVLQDARSLSRGGRSERLSGGGRHEGMHLHQLLYCVSSWLVTITTYLLAGRRQIRVCQGPDYGCLSQMFKD